MTEKIKKTFSAIFIGLIVAFALYLSTGAVEAVVFQRPVYVQNVTANSIEINWKTDVNVASVVNYGISPSYGQQANADPSRKVIDGSPGYLQHAKITGLQPNTKYYYQIVSGATNLTAAGDANYVFKTAPTVGSSTPFNFVVWGDSGNESADQFGVANSALGKKPDLAFITGDVSYGGSGYGSLNYKNGEPSQDAAYFDVYQKMMTYTPFYPTCGNHDDNPVLGNITGCDVMMDEHSFPGGGKMGGGVNSTYSFDYGNSHFVSLYTGGGINYNSASPGASNPQMLWAYNDLKNSQQTWKFLFFHFNGWSSGSHGTNPNVVSYILRMAQDTGVNGVFWGHSHVFERFGTYSQASGRGTGPFYYTIGNGGKGGAASSCGSYANGPLCLAASGVGSVPSGSGYLYAQVNAGSLKIDYITSSGTVADSASYGTAQITVSPNPTLRPTSTPFPNFSPSPTTIQNTPPPATTAPTNTGTVCLTNPPTNSANATLSLNLSGSGIFRVWTRMLPTGSNADSFYLQVDGGCQITVGDLVNLPINSWLWVNSISGTTAPLRMSLGAGSHVVKLIAREQDVRIDRLLFTLDQTCVPTGIGDNCLGISPSSTTTINPSQRPSSTVSLTPDPTLSVQKKIVLIPTDDAYVSSNARSRNFGKSDRISVGRSPIQIGYLKFNLKNKALMGKKIVSAKLQLKVINKSQGTQRLRSVNNTSWKENRITYSNRPGVGNSVVGEIKPVNKGKLVEVSLDKYVKSKIGGLMSIAIDSKKSNRVDFKSKEAKSDKPQLIIYVQ